MKRVYSITLIMLLALSYISCSRPVSEVIQTPQNFEEIKNNFQDPPAAFRSYPFWSLNHDLQEDEIDHQLHEFKAVGMGGVIMHSRPGLITPYFSDRYHKVIDYSVKKGEELGLQMWLYDENSWPSGFGGGLVNDAMPESYQKGQGLKLHRLQKLDKNSEDDFKIILINNEDGFADITGRVSDYLGKEGDYWAFELMFYDITDRYAGFSYVDLIMPGVTEKFIEITMGGYDPYLKEKYAKSIPGIFTDEPNIRPPGRNTVRWTPDLFEQFQNRWGYDLLENLPSLFRPVGDYRKVRHNYYQLLLQLFIDRWSKPWYEYTEKNHLLWTGHYWEHGWPNPQHGGDNMAMYAWHQVPAIDMLFNSQSLRSDQFGNDRAVRELASVANQLGRKRTLSETYGGSGWELGFEDMKRLGDWEFALGVNILNQHLTYYTITGQRKYDFPQSISYHAPYWDQYKVQTDYFGRLSYALSAGEQINKVLVIEPTTTAWMYTTFMLSPAERQYITDAEDYDKKMDQIHESFHGFIDTLERLQVEYDIGCENIMKDHGSAKNGTMTIGLRDYDVVILPPSLESLDATSMAILKKYLASGGKLLSFAQNLTYIDGAKTNQFEKLSTQYDSQWIQAKSMLDSNVLKWIRSEDIQFDASDNAKGTLYHHRRILNDGQILFLSNFNPDELAEGSFKIKGQSVQQLDLISGNISAYPFEVKKDFVRLNYSLPPAASLLLFVSPEESDSPAPTYKRYVSVQSASELVIDRVQENAMPIDYCDIKIADNWLYNVHYYDATDSLFRYYGFTQGDPWGVNLQFKDEVIKQNNFSDETGFEVIYSFTVAPHLKANVIKGLKLVIENPDLYDVFVNGQSVDRIPDAWWLDRLNGVYAIGSAVQSGENKVTLVCKPMSVFAEVEPIFILGDFGLSNASKGWQLINEKPMKLGSWKKQGLPTYHHQVVYSKTVQLDQIFKIKIQLGDWKGTVADVKINGKSAGIIGWPPYELEITEGLKAGKNKIEVIVVGSLKNLLGPFHKAQRPGIVTPWSWRYCPQSQPGGKEYQVLDYGLFEDFEVFIEEER